MAVGGRVCGEALQPDDSTGGTVGELGLRHGIRRGHRDDPVHEGIAELQLMRDTRRDEMQSFQPPSQESGASVSPRRFATSVVNVRDWPP